MAILNKIKQKVGQMNARPQMGAPAGDVAPPPNMGRMGQAAQGMNNISGAIQNFRNLREPIGNRGIGAGVGAPRAVPGFTPSGPPMGMPPMENRPPPPPVDMNNMRTQAMGQMGQMGSPMGQPPMGQPGMGMQPQLGGMFGGYRNVAQNQQNDNQRIMDARNRARVAMQGQQFDQPPTY